MYASPSWEGYKKNGSEVPPSNVRACGECRRAAVKRRGGKHVEVASPLTSTLETITSRNTACGGEKEGNVRIVNRETNDGLLALFVVYQLSEIRTHANEKVRPLLPVFGEAGRVIYQHVQSSGQKYAMRECV